MKSHNDRHEGNGCPKLLQQVQNAWRTNHYSYRTEQTYVQWIKRVVLYYSKLNLSCSNKPRTNTGAKYRNYLTARFGREGS